MVTLIKVNEAYQMRKKIFENNHQCIAKSLYAMSQIFRNQKKYLEAQEKLREAFAIASVIEDGDSMLPNIERSLEEIKSAFSR